MHGWLQDKLTQRVGGCTCADGEVGCTDVIAHEAVFTCSVTTHGGMLDCFSDRVGIADGHGHYRVQAVIAMTCPRVAFALPCCSCLALLVWKVDGPLPTQIHPFPSHLPLGHEACAATQSLLYSTSHDHGHSACCSLHLLTSTLLPRATLTASVVDSLILLLHCCVASFALISTVPASLLHHTPPVSTSHMQPG